MAMLKSHSAPNLPQPEAASEVASHLLEECRMVLPGIQALFGFQLIAVFNNKFGEMPEAHQTLHLLAIVFVTISIAFVMTPAAYHRQAHQFAISRTFVQLSSLLLLLSMILLSVGICLDVYVVCALITGSDAISLMVALAAALLFALLWFVFPRCIRNP
ncbi:MAG: hypothetical protein KF854_13350 [Nitrospira sp.]|nr:hypothetical protein [Nitrospira sp.]MBX3342178.1 hypothetical protein [Nitrospira sp.]MBX3369211.1 hypothetical protein [Nitrospira sp.]MCW5794324.1 hypothetical protein [Nitrospira sp.]HMU30230.1 DUF6328 family protein [Nitrospira sp.]